MSTTPTLGLVKNAAGTLNWTNSMNTNLDELDAAIATLRAMVASVSASVSSVYGRTGAVTAQSGDYNFSQIAGTVAASQLPPIPASDITGVLPVANGGTAATTGVDALQNLGGQPVGEKGQPNGYASLDGNGMLPSSQLPALAIDHTYVVATQAAMLALAANVGDLAVRSDINNTFILQTLPASTLANWIQVLTPSSPVQSVNGQVGNVNLTPANIGAASLGANTFTGAQTAPALNVNGQLNSQALSLGGGTTVTRTSGTGNALVTTSGPDTPGAIAIWSTGFDVVGSATLLSDIPTLTESNQWDGDLQFFATQQFRISPQVPATASGPSDGTIFQLESAYFDGIASSLGDFWTFQNILGTGNNPTSTLQISHAGSSGAALLSINSPLTATGATFEGPAAFVGDVNSVNGSSATGVYVGTGSGFPLIKQISSSAPPDAKVYDSFVGSDGTLFFRTVNDGADSANNWLTVSRSGVTATSISLLASVQLTSQGLVIPDSANGHSYRLQITNGAVVLTQVS